MVEKKFRCPKCNKIISLSGLSGETLEISCPGCGTKGKVVFGSRNNHVVETDGLTKKFGGLVAVNSLNFFY